MVEKRGAETIKIQFRNSQDAFERAINSGRLSADKSAKNYAGKYMYMGTRGSYNLFKHIDTREYLSTETVFDKEPWRRG